MPQKIKLYHGTTLDGLSSILENELIDANKGKQTGETHGVNWFFVKYDESFSRGFMFSIVVDKSELDNGVFRFMNSRVVVSYDSIDIVSHDFFIEQAFGLRFEQLKNGFKKCLKEENDDFFEGYNNFFESLSRGYHYGYIFPDDPIMLQLMRQFGYGDNDLRDKFGIMEGHRNVQFFSEEKKPMTFRLKEEKVRRILIESIGDVLNETQ